MKNKDNIYIGIDPDIRILNASVFTESGGVKIFARKNLKPKGDEAVISAARSINKLVYDVINYVVSISDVPGRKVITTIENQSMMHTKRMRDKGFKISYDSIRKLAQVTGCFMGVFSNMTDTMFLPIALEWKGTIPKDVSHYRIYQKLNIEEDTESKIANIHPNLEDIKKMSDWSEDKINPGDFKDINDSLGLALYSLKKDN